jgi:rubrerythrin
MGFVAAVLLLAFATLAGDQAKTPKDVVLADLQTAMNNEFNARARYRAFADKAIEEGYGEVASLMRAAARAEEVHAGRFMSLLTARGGTGEATMETPEVSSTKENLQKLVSAEKYERDTLYPKFADDARAAGDKRAAEVFDLVRNAEVEHFNLCAEASNKLDQMTGPSKSFWVCRGCGYTTPVYTGGKCPFCSGSAELFVQIE